MKLMFNKETLEGHWFDDDEDTNRYTDKIPLHANCIFDEVTDNWIEKEIIQNDVD